MSYRVLVYHAVGEHPASLPSGFAMTPAAFAAHVDCVLDSGWTVVGLERIVARLESGLPPEPDTLAITFDDGYAGWIEHVARPLAERRLPATFFVAAGLVDRSFAHGPVRMDAISRSDLAEIARMPGFEVGSHGMTHTSLPGLAEETLATELAGSRRALEDLCQSPVRWLAYPFGAFDSPVQEAARRAGYRDAFTVWTRREGRFSRLRIPLHERDGTIALRLKLSSLYFPVKAVLRG
jgi:peptidoglycan/xylan/chitin deacetylase (PgdA/CDA1 family)